MMNMKTHTIFPYKKSLVAIRISGNLISSS